MVSSWVCSLKLSDQCSWPLITVSALSKCAVAWSFAVAAAWIRQRNWIRSKLLRSSRVKCFSQRVLLEAWSNGAHLVFVSNCSALCVLPSLSLNAFHKFSAAVPRIRHCTRFLFRVHITLHTHKRAGMKTQPYVSRFVARAKVCAIEGERGGLWVRKPPKALWTAEATWWTAEHIR